MSEKDDRQVILTIDDEEVIRASFRYFLEDYGFKVLEAENGRSGLAMFRRHKPDLVLVDLRMPEVDGLEVLGQVTVTSPDTPIIVISGTGIIADAVEALRLGAWDYLLKPVEDLTVLMHAVNRCLERASLLKENRQYKEHLEDMVRLRTKQLEATNSELKETRMEIIRRLGKAAEYKDNETGKHVIRVGLYSGLLAEKLELDEETVELIRICSPMHDLGKIGIPDYIMKKMGPLDTDEWQIMKKHTSIGRQMLEPLPEEDLILYRSHTTIGENILGGSDSKLLETARKIAAFHHERWDGNGYPHGLKGEDIPIEARIVAIADNYDALSTKRSYKEPFLEEVCQLVLQEMSGSYLDPGIVELFFQNLDEILKIKEEWQD